jgi:predicted glycosyltransferase
MNILIDIAHPAHFHNIKNLYFKLVENHNIIVACQSIPIVKKLLNSYQIPYIEIGEKGKNIQEKIFKQFSFNRKIKNIAKERDIDLAIGSSLSVFASRGTKAKSILLDEDDQNVQPFTAKFISPYADHILSPDALSYENVKNAIYYPGNHELAYLHPNVFTPDPNMLVKYGLSKNDKYFILRFNAFKAHHDIHQYGLNKEQKHILIDTLLKYGKVFITTEAELEPEFEEFKMPISPEEMHSFLYYSQMLISDSQTMSVEAAVLGVPSFRCNTFANRLSVLEELELRYGLTFGYHPSQFYWMLYRINEFLETTDFKDEWQKRRMRLLQDKIDVTSFWVWFVENYPESVKEVKLPEFSFDRFK